LGGGGGGNSCGNPENYLHVIFFNSQQASECLKKHTHEIKLENQRLRSELQQVIDATNDLQMQKKKLDKQYRSLLREHQFNQDLQRLRGSVFRGLGSNNSTHSFSFGRPESGKGEI
jgi:chromosome segregation ATPase